MALLSKIHRKIQVFRCQLIFINIMRKFHEIRLFTTVCCTCKEREKNFCNHESRLQRIFFPLQPRLTVAKSLISWDFPINMAFGTALFGKFHKKCRFFFLNQRKNPSFQPLVMVAQGKICFVTMTHGCKAVILIPKKVPFENYE